MRIKEPWRRKVITQCSPNLLTTWRTFFFHYPNSPFQSPTTERPLYSKRARVLLNLPHPALPVFAPFIFLFCFVAAGKFVDRWSTQLLKNLFPLPPHHCFLRLNNPLLTSNNYLSWKTLDSGTLYLKIQTWIIGKLNEDIEVILVGYICGDEFVDGQSWVYQLSAETVIGRNFSLELIIPLTILTLMCPKH